MLPSPARSTIAEGCDSVRLAARMLAGHVYSRPVAAIRVTSATARVPSSSATRCSVTSPDTATRGVPSWAVTMRTSASAPPRTRPVMGTHG
jgi:hypothetical protein